MSSEADLCRRFIAWVTPQGWTAYAETGDWDVLLVHADGTQIGVQAKKHFNATLIRQAMPVLSWSYGSVGPDYRAVLLPRWNGDVEEVCKLCGLGYFYNSRFHHRNDRHHTGGSDFKPEIRLVTDRLVQWPAEKRVPLPAYVPDVAAGASAPVRLTDWKIGALRICALLEIRGFVTLADFKHYRIDHRRWVPMDWLRFEAGRYLRGPRLMFDKQHPVNYQQILADVRQFEADRQREPSQKPLKLKPSK